MYSTFGVVTTTHYNLLKEMAELDERFENASVEFDPETYAPTYRVRIGPYPMDTDLALGLYSVLAALTLLGIGVALRVGDLRFGRGWPTGRS